jgi:hypothetical protein
MSISVFTRRLMDGCTMFIVAALSLSLLLYVGFADGKRTFEQIELEKLTAQGLLVQSSIEKFLRDGLPLKQYPGFSTLAGPIVNSQPEVDTMAVYDQSGRRLFQVVDKSNPKLPEPSSVITRIEKKIEIDYGETHYQVVVPLRTRFETVGALVIMAKTDFVSHQVEIAFPTADVSRRRASRSVCAGNIVGGCSARPQPHSLAANWLRRDIRADDGGGCRDIDRSVFRRAARQNPVVGSRFFRALARPCRFQPRYQGFQWPRQSLRRIPPAEL